MSCQYIFDFASGLWSNELGSPSNVTVTTISGWATSNYILGQLGNLTFQCFSGSDGCPVPALGPSELSILSEMYKITYYNGLVKSSLGAGGTRKVQELVEGDSRIKWQNDNETAKIYSNLGKDAANNLKYLVRSYNQGNKNQVRSVDFYNIN